MTIDCRELLASDLFVGAHTFAGGSALRQGLRPSAGASAKVLSADRANTYRRLNELCNAGEVRRVENHGVTCYAVVKK